jgi:hypothetical protein
MSIGPGSILTPFWGATMVLNIYATGEPFQVYKYPSLEYMLIHYSLGGSSDE